MHGPLTDSARVQRLPLSLDRSRSLSCRLHSRHGNAHARLHTLAFRRVLNSFFVFFLSFPKVIMMMKIVPVRARSAWRGVLTPVCCAARRLALSCCAAHRPRLPAHLSPPACCELPADGRWRVQFHSLFSGDPMGVPALNPCTMKNSSYYVW